MVHSSIGLCIVSNYRSFARKKRHPEATSNKTVNNRWLTTGQPSVIFYRNAIEYNQPVLVSSFGDALYILYIQYMTH